MLKPFPLLLSLLLLPVVPVKALSPFSAPAIVAEDSPNAQIERSIRQVTVKITSEINRGSGIIIGKKGSIYLVLTNAHVTRGATTLQIQTHDGQTRTASIAPNSLLKDKDLALVEFSDTRDYPIAKIRAISPDAELDITVTGYSAETGQYTTDNGKIEQTSDRPLQEGYSVGYSGEVVQGMSGGGIFFEDELIGINGRSAYPILSNYTYEDGTKPTDAEIQQMRAVNWGISINTLLTYIRPEILTAYQLPLPKSSPGIENPTYTGYIAQLETKAKGFTVRIDSSSQANGSGAIIAREGKSYTVLTADHVLCEKISEEKTCADYTYTLTTSDGKTLPLDRKTIIRQEGVDLAIFTFESNENYPVAEIANYSPNRESPIFVAGFPKIGDKRAGWLFSGGAVKSQEEGLLATRQSDFTITQSGASIRVSSLSGGYDMVYTSITFGGMSGGPVLNAAGQVIGIHGRSEGVKGKIQLGFSLGIPINSFIGLQERFRVKLSSFVTAQPQLTAQQQQQIDRTLVSVEVPETNASADIWIERGNQLWRLKKDDRALQAFDRAIQLNDPEYTYLAWYGKALVYNRQYQYRDALEAIEKALATLPTREQGSEFHAEILHERGSLYWALSLGQYEKAIESYEQAIKIFPRNPNYYNSLSTLLVIRQSFIRQDVRQYDRALEAINRAIEIAPRSGWYSNRGMLYGAWKKWDLALADYNKALALNPNNARAYINRADVYKERKEFDLALADYNRAIEIDANFAGAYASRGIFYMARKKWDLALADYNRAISIDPDNPILSFPRGIFYHFQGRNELALADFTRVIDSYSYQAVAYIMRGLAYVSLKKWDLALADLNRAIELDPNSAFGYGGRGGLYEGRREWDLALADYNRAIELDPNSAASYEARGNLYNKQQKWDLAIADYSRAIELGNFDGYSRRGSVYFQQQKWDLALADYNKAIETAPNPELAYFQRGALYELQKKGDLALADYSQAIRLNPYFELFYRFRGSLYYRQNQLDLALADYNKAIELNSNEAVLYYNRGKIYQQQQKWDLALSDYSRSIELDPNCSSAYLQLGRLYFQQKNWDLALASITRSIEIDGKPDSYFMRGKVYLQLGKWDLALADLNKAIDLNSQGDNAYSLRGDIYRIQKKWDLALADLDRAIAINQNNAIAYYIRGILYYQTEKWDLALADFDKAIALDPKLKESYNFRGDIYKRQKRYSEALQDYQKLLELDEKNLIAITNIGLIHYEQGDLNLASSQFQKSLEINPQSAENQLALAVTLYRQGNTEKAIKLAKSALKIDPEFAQVETLQKNLWGDKIIADARKLFSQL
ncbi:serine protease [Microcystis sp. M169S2]|uniref:serine protease n=2 Tax=Microcystis TaxID=1125 RepID=UPI0025894B39|nr:serine protease [Microcystis sp. M169S2]MCA2716869.1 tetratricopeptide repeat protein [Microcystis sp. M169S2]